MSSVNMNSYAWNLSNGDENVLAFTSNCRILPSLTLVGTIAAVVGDTVVSIDG